MGTQDTIVAVADDGSLFKIDKLLAHQNGQRHLAVSVFVFDGPYLLMQKRASGKYHSPNMWANTCCSHPRWGEKPADCAARRLQEELGIRVPLRFAGTIEYRADVGRGLQENELVTLFVNDHSREELKLSPNDTEVTDTKWMTFDEICAATNEDPDAFAPWFRIYLRRFPELFDPTYSP